MQTDLENNNWNKINISVSLTPQDIAVAFSQMDEKEQSMFFNHILKCFDNVGALNTQLHAVSGCPLLDDDGSYAMRQIGLYGEPYTPNK